MIILSVHVVIALVAQPHVVHVGIVGHVRPCRVRIGHVRIVRPCRAKMRKLFSVYRYLLLKLTS